MSDFLFLCIVGAVAVAVLLVVVRRFAGRWRASRNNWEASVAERRAKDLVDVDRLLKTARTLEHRPSYFPAGQKVYGAFCLFCRSEVEGRHCDENLYEVNCPSCGQLNIVGDERFAESRRGGDPWEVLGARCYSCRAQLRESDRRWSSRQNHVEWECRCGVKVSTDRLAENRSACKLCGAAGGTFWVNAFGVPGAVMYSVTSCSACSGVKITSAPSISMERDRVGDYARRFGTAANVAVLACSGLILGVLVAAYVAGWLPRPALLWSAGAWVVASAVFGWVWPETPYWAWNRAGNHFYRSHYVRGLGLSVAATAVTSVLFVGALGQRAAILLAKLKMRGLAGG
jgi:hypothetical protein